MTRDRSRGSAKRRDVYDDMASQADADEGALQQQLSLPAGTLLKKDGHSAVTVFSELPREVREALEAAGEQSEAARKQQRWGTERDLLPLSFFL
jgi:hypothetical protein